MKVRARIVERSVIGTWIMTASTTASTADVAGLARKITNQLCGIPDSMIHRHCDDQTSPYRDPRKEQLMKMFVTGLVLFGGAILYMVGFIFLMTRAIIDPVEANPEVPLYNLWAILEWLAYICLGGATTFWLVFGGESGKR